MEYTQDTFLELLGENFGEVLFEGGRYYIEGIDNKDIANKLDYDNSSFSGCMKAGNKVSYETIIKRLQTYKKLQIFKTEQTNMRSSLEENQHRLKTVKWQRNFMGGLAALAMFAVIFLGIILPSKLENSLQGFTKKTSSTYVGITKEKWISSWNGMARS